MKVLSVLIVDDEPLAREILETYVSKTSSLQLVGICANALEAFTLLNTTPVDLLLTDINMPEISGIAFINALKQPPLTIFTTAYSEYAVESYELNAVDYLVKPISFDRFLKAIQKAQDLHSHYTPAATIMQHAVTASTPQERIIFVKTNGKLRKVDLNQLWMVEALKDYLKLYVAEERIIVHSTMKNMEEQLAAQHEFLRVNKSYIVNARFIDEVMGNTILIHKMQVPIGNTYKEVVFDFIERRRL